MVHALGFSHTEFNPARPGRLCRGRERWIEPFEIEAPDEPVHRLVLSGAAFTDDSAADALRGLPHSNVDLAQVMGSLFPRRKLLAFCEDGHPADIPDDALHVELYDGHRSGGRAEEVRVRWVKEVSGVREIREVLGPQNEDVAGFVLLDKDTDVEALLDPIFLLTGFSTLDSPPARFQPSALPDVLALVKAVILVHRDKHGAALGIYSTVPIKTDGRLEGLCEKAGSVLVHFAIPPMLARWDRAIAEARTLWAEANGDPESFPVPRSTAPSPWERRRRHRRGGGMNDDDDLEDEQNVDDDDLIGDDEDEDDDDDPLFDDDDLIVEGEDVVAKKPRKPQMVRKARRARYEE